MSKEGLTVYKLRHKPTGLFYQPVKGRWAEEKSNLSKRGKIYETKQYPKDLHTGGVQISDSLAKEFELTPKTTVWGNYLITKEGDWEIVIYNLIEGDE